MKKFIAIIIGLALFIPYTSAYYEYTQRVTVLSFDAWTNNFTIEHEGKTMLLHYTGSCDDMEEGDQVIISVRSVLDGYSDNLVLSSYRRCAIDQAQEINSTMTVTKIFSNYMSLLTDKDGNEYEIQYNANCMSIPRYWHSEVYFYQSGSTPSVGDKIHLPADEGSCSVLYVKKRLPLVEVEQPEGDIKRPTMVSEVTATPGNGVVWLSWRSASDDDGVDHYIISYFPYSLRTDTYTVDQMPNKIVTENNATTYKITGLTNEDIYFFYVIAVDTNGNISSDWSPEVNATPKSAIMQTTSTVRTRLHLYKTQETYLSYLFRWNRIPAFSRQTVILEVDGERDFVFTDWSKDYIRILKKDSRKGRSLNLAVRQYDTYGGMFEDEYEFGF
jgi:hypothetical protein